MFAGMRIGLFYLCFVLISACDGDFSSSSFSSSTADSTDFTDQVIGPKKNNQSGDSHSESSGSDQTFDDQVDTDSMNQDHSSHPTTTTLKAENGLQSVILNDLKQSVYIQSKDFTQPILLVLHGGPGFGMMPLLHQSNAELEEHFVVINWDQRGAGLSYDASISEESLSLAQLIEDAQSLTQVLKVSFQQEKIYLLGHSFGTVVAMYLLEKKPEDYYAYAGVGQVINVIENEQLSYDFALSEAQDNHNVTAINELVAVGRPDDNGEYLDDSGYEMTAKWLAYYGGALVGETSLEEVETLILSNEPYLGKKQQWLDGWQLSQALFYDDQVWEFDFRIELNQVDVPVYFLIGRQDYGTPVALVEEYFSLLQAPDKELIWFEQSAHFPFYEQPDLFNKTLFQLLQQHVKVQ